MHGGKTNVINGKVYSEGGRTNAFDDGKYIVYCYDLSQDNWTTLPPLPVRRFGLLAIGGVETSEGDADKKEVYMFSPSTNSWIYIMQ